MPSYRSFTLLKRLYYSIQFGKVGVNHNSSVQGIKPLLVPPLAGLGLSLFPGPCRLHPLPDGRPGVFPGKFDLHEPARARAPHDSPGSSGHFPVLLCIYSNNRSARPIKQAPAAGRPRPEGIGPQDVFVPFRGMAARSQGTSALCPFRRERRPYGPPRYEERCLCRGIGPQVRGAAQGPKEIHRGWRSLIVRTLPPSACGRDQDPYCAST